MLSTVALSLLHASVSVSNGTDAGAVLAQSDGLFGRLVAAMGSEHLEWLLAAGGVAMVVTAFLDTQRRSARKLQAWRERGDRAGMPFSARLAEQLRKLDEGEG